MAFEVVNVDLKAITVQVLNAGFLARGIAVLVGVSDPKNFAQLPFVGVNLMSDTETNSHIGDALADEYIGLEDEIYVGESTLFTQNVEVKLWSTNDEERDTLGRRVKEVLFGGRGTSVNPGLFVSTDGISGGVKISGGHDEGISDTSGQYAPHDLYTRTYYVTAITELTLQEPGGGSLKGFTLNGRAYEADIYQALEPHPTHTPFPSF